VIAGFLSGKLIGNMMATSITPNTKPHTGADEDSRHGTPFRPLLTRGAASKAAHRLRASTARRELLSSA
jgi:hypothetical protein